MALIACPDCAKQVSSSAAACIHCGAPLAAATAAARQADTPPAKAMSAGKLWLIIGAAVLAALVIGAVSNDGTAPRMVEATAAEKDRCARAMMSSIGHSTLGYADKAAYEARVRDACAGLTIDGKDLGQFGR
jgi:hypothetical protein